MLEARLCSKLPSLNFQSLLNDPILARYMRSNAKKAKEYAEKGYPEMPQPRKKRLQRTVQQNDDYGGSSESSFSCNLSHVSFEQPTFQRECQFEEPMMEEEEEEERQMAVKVEAASEEEKGVGLFADIRIDDI